MFSDLNTIDKVLVAIKHICPGLRMMQYNAIIIAKYEDYLILDSKLTRFEYTRIP